MFKKFKNIFRNIVISSLVLSFVVGMFGGTVAYADSTDRITTFISLASGKQTTDLDINNLGLTERDLQFLGVYISNFFIPFGTELGVGKSEDTTSQNKEDIKKALQTNLQYSDTMATTLTDTLLGLTEASASKQTLTLCVSKKYQKDLKEVPYAPLNSYTAYSCMFGGLRHVANRWRTDAGKDFGGNTVVKDIADGKYRWGYFAYQKDGKYIPVFDFFIDLESYTPSQAVFFKCLESVDIKNGYGFNFADFVVEEIGTTNSDYKESLAKIQDDIDMAYRMTINGDSLAVDCFGNIIIKGANHQYIAVPGCMNPYTWVTVDSKGDDAWGGVEKGVSAGRSYNIVNLQSMMLIDNEGGTKLYKGDVKNEDDVPVMKLDTSKLAATLDDLGGAYGGGSGSYDVYPLRRVRGEKDSSLSNINGFSDILGEKTFKDIAKNSESGFVKSHSKSYNYAHSGGDFVYFPTKNDTTLGKSKLIQDGELSLSGSVRYEDSFAFLDDLGAWHYEHDSSESFSTVNVFPYISDEGAITGLRESVKSVDSGFKNLYQDIKSGKMDIPDNISKEAVVSLYFTYALAGLYNEDSPEAKEASIGKLGYRLNKEGLPAIPDKPLELSQEAKDDYMTESIKGFVYYLLHPTEGITYVATLLKNKINGFNLMWHNDMVGTNGTGSLTGTTNYRGFSGYVTTPELTDLPWTNSLLDLYNTAIPFFIVFMIIVMLCAYIVGIFNLQKAIIGLAIFSICIALPPITVNGLVGTSNRFSSKLYGEKFTYWALVEHESYSTAIDEAAKGDSYENYLKTLYATNSEAKGNQGSESVMLKWQAPKKMASLMMTEKDESIFDSSSSKLLSGLINKTYSGESYLDKESVYLYRSYIDIANFSMYIHRGIDEGIKPVNLSITSDITGNWDSELKQNYLNNYSSIYENDRSLGYANKNADGSSDGVNDNILRVRVPMSSKIVSDAISARGTVGDLSIDDYIGIDQRAFNFSIPMFNDKNLKFLTELKTEDGFDPTKGGYTEEDYTGLAAYGLMSENPFYYFSWYLYETGLTTNVEGKDGYKNLLLGSDNAGFFYNTVGNGELKDFMDMRSMFTYLIPYLKQGNDLVREWDETYGIYYYEGVPTEEGHENDEDIKNNKELRQKYWHNLNVARLYNLYTPWVDIMYDCSYAKPEKITYLGDSYMITDPLDPASYPEDRPMIFSKSEMVDYGMSEKDLTKVERLILECQEGMQERMFNLLNYHSFNDVVLNTASAMNCAFEFNETFSENSLFGANHNIYPQSFELNDFSYDAFLRFILSNSTGESMVVDGDSNFYDIITQKSSLTTTILLLVLDIVCMYILPGLKMFFIVGVFLAGVLIVLMSACHVDPEQKFVKRLMVSFVKPMVKFIAITCGLAWIVSLFMGEGYTGITGSMKPTIQLGDPVMVMVIMLILNCTVVFLYFKLLLGVWHDIKKFGSIVGNFMSGVFGALGGVITGFMRSKVSASGVTSGGSAGGGISGNSSSKEPDLGSASPRARSRGASITVNAKIARSNRTRLSSKDRRLMKQNNKYMKKDLKDRGVSTSRISSTISKGFNKMRGSNKSKKSDKTKK